MRNLTRSFRRELTNLKTIAQKVASLFRNGEQGVWYDPSDFSTMFQDAAGTTPVTAVGQPVGLLLDKSKGLALSSELVTNGTFDSNIAGWTAGSANSNIIWNSGKLRVSTTALNSVGKSAYQAFPVIAGKWYVISGSATLVEGTVTTVQVALRDGISAETSSVVASSNLMLHTVSSGTFYYYADTTRTLYLHCRIFNTTQPCTVDFENISAKEIAGNHATQATAASRPVLQQDGTGRYFLLFDGVDDGMQTGNINFTTTDKMTVWSGVRKLSDAANGEFLALGAWEVGATGRFTHLFPGASGVNKFAFGAHNGAFLAVTTSTTHNAPVTRVVTTEALDRNKLRLNGVAISESALVSGFFVNEPLYIGRRSNGTSPFNGRLYSLIVRGAQSTATQISNAETYVNSKTGAY